jgi:hypothetical protein
MIVASLFTGACANRAPLTDQDAASAIRNSEVFVASGTCDEGIIARRELVAVMTDVCIVTCDSGAECSCIVKFQWQWKSDSRSCGAATFVSYGRLARREDQEDKAWRPEDKAWLMVEMNPQKQGENLRPRKSRDSSLATKRVTICKIR